MNIIKFIRESFENFSKIRRKYFFTMLISSLLSLSMLFFMDTIVKDDIYRNILITLSFGIPLFAKVEGYEFENIKKSFIIKIISAIFLLLLYFYIPFDPDYKSTVMLLSLAVIILTALFFIPNKKYTKETSTNYFTKVFVSFVSSISYSFVLYAGIILTIQSFLFLFKIEWDSDWPLRIYFMVLYFFSVAYFLIGIEEERDYLYSNFVKKFLKYIFLPLLIVYGVILYLYLIRLGVLKEYPKGLIPFMIIAYCTVGTFYLYIAENMNEGKIHFAFKKYFYYSLIPLLPLLFYSIIVRINQYGVTENRYYIFLTALWLSTVIFINVFYKMKYLHFIPVLFMVSVFISAIGPLSAGNISLKSQKKRINMLIEKAGDIWTKENSREFSRLLDYFEDYHTLADSGLTSDETISKGDLAKKFGAEFKEEYQWVNNENYIGLKNASEIIKFEGYDYFINNSYFENNKFYNLENLKIKTAYLDNKEAIIIGENKYVLDSIRKEIFDREKDKEIKNLSYVIESDTYKIKIYFQELYSYDEGVEVYGNGMIIFIKILV